MHSRSRPNRCHRGQCGFCAAFLFAAGSVNPFGCTAEITSLPPLLPVSFWHVSPRCVSPPSVPLISIFFPQAAPLFTPSPFCISFWRSISAVSFRGYLIESIQVRALGIFSFFYAANRRLSRVCARHARSRGSTMSARCSLQLCHLNMHYRQRRKYCASILYDISSVKWKLSSTRITYFSNVICISHIL